MGERSKWGVSWLALVALVALALAGCSRRTEQRTNAAVHSAERDLRADTRRAGASIEHAAHDVRQEASEAAGAATSPKERAIAASRAERAAQEAATHGTPLARPGESR